MLVFKPRSVVQDPDVYAQFMSIRPNAKFDLSEPTVRCIDSLNHGFCQDVRLVLLLADIRYVSLQT